MPDAHVTFLGTLLSHGDSSSAEGLRSPCRPMSVYGTVFTVSAGFVAFLCAIPRRPNFPVAYDVRLEWCSDAVLLHECK